MNIRTSLAPIFVTILLMSAMGALPRNAALAGHLASEGGGDLCPLC